MRTGVCTLACGKLIMIVTGFIARCPHCIRLGGIDRPYTHAPGDPRLLQMVGDECPIFSVVSIDLFTDIYVLSHSKARGKPSYPVCVLIASCLVLKSVSLIVLDGATTRDVCNGLQLLSLRYRLPKVVVVDSGPQLRNLPEHSELTTALSEDGIKIVVMPQNHQFGNFSEIVIAEAKKILNSLREDSNSSMYRQPQSLLELQGKLILAENMMSLRPILCTTKDQEHQLLTPRQLTHPFISLG